MYTYIYICIYYDGAAGDILCGFRVCMSAFRNVYGRVYIEKFL